MSKVSELLKKSPEALGKELIEKRHEQFNLRMQLSSGQLSKNHLIREVRRDIARIKTVQAQIKSSNNSDKKGSK